MAKPSKGLPAAQRGPKQRATREVMRQLAGLPAAHPPPPSSAVGPAIRERSVVQLPPTARRKAEVEQRREHQPAAARKGPFKAIPKGSRQP